MQTNSPQASARAVFAGKYGETTGKYGGLRVGEIGVAEWYLAWGRGMSRGFRRRNAKERGRRGSAADTGTRQTKERHGRTGARSRSWSNRVRGAIAFARWRAHTRARGPPPTHSTRKQSGRHSQTRSKCVSFAASLPERRDAREGSYASEARTARGRQCFERMNGGIIGGLGFVCQVKSFWYARKCR